MPASLCCLFQLDAGNEANCSANNSTGEVNADTCVWSDMAFLKFLKLEMFPGAKPGVSSSPPHPPSQVAAYPYPPVYHCLFCHNSLPPSSSIPQVAAYPSLSHSLPLHFPIVCWAVTVGTRATGWPDYQRPILQKSYSESLQRKATILGFSTFDCPCERNISLSDPLLVVLFFFEFISTE